MQQGAFRESQALVNLDGASVLWEDVQDGLFATVEDAVNQFGDQNAGVAVTEMVGMRAYGADLGVARKLEALASHGRQCSSNTDAKIISHLVGSRAEGAGLVSLVRASISGTSASVSRITAGFG